MYAQLSISGIRFKNVVQIGDEAVGITQDVIDAFPELFVDITGRTDYPETTETVWYDTENALFVTEPEEFIEHIPAPTQLDRIEAAVNAKNEEIAQNAIDNYTLELMEGGLL